MKNFVERCCMGEANLKDIELHITMWHEGQGRNQELHQYLGMTRDEFNAWQNNPQSLEETIKHYLKD